MPATLPTNTVYDLFAITTAQERQTLLSFTGVSVTGGGSLTFDSNTGFSSLKDTGTGGTTVLEILPTASIPEEFGFEAAILLPTGNLPVDFSSPGTDRIFIGIENILAGDDIVAGFLISEAGIAIANSPSVVNTVLPGTDVLISEFRRSSGEPLVIRAAFNERSGSPIIRTLSIAIGSTIRQTFEFEEGSLPFTPTGPDRFIVEAIAPVSNTREILLGFMGLSSNIDTYVITVQPNPGPDQVVELGEIVRLDGTKSLPKEQIVFSGKDLRSVSLEPTIDSLGNPISLLGDAAADGSGFTDTFTITSPAALLNTEIGDFIEIAGVSHVIDTIAFPVVTVEEPRIATTITGITGLIWQTYSSTLVEAVSTDLFGAVVGDTLRINEGDNAGLYAVSSVPIQDSPFRLEIATPLRVAAVGMNFDIGPKLTVPTTVTWTYIGGPTNSTLQDFVDIHRDGDILRFVPDVTGTFKFELQLDSPVVDFVPSFIDVVVEVIDSRVSLGEIPNAHFVWSYLSNFWSLLADREIAETTWSGSMQVLADELYKLYQVDYNKSLNDIQRRFRRKWMKIDTRQDITTPEFNEDLPFGEERIPSQPLGSILPSGIFQHSSPNPEANLLASEVVPGDVLRFGGHDFAIELVLSSTQASIVKIGEPVTAGLPIWTILKGLYIQIEEDAEDLQISHGDTVRFAVTHGNVTFRVEESVVFVDGRQIYITPDTPFITEALVARGLSYSDVTIVIEGIRRQTIFPIAEQVVSVLSLQEIIKDPLLRFLQNLNYRTEPKKVTTILDFDDRLPFNIKKASGIAGAKLADNVFEDASATFLSSGVRVEDQLIVGVDTFKVTSVRSETRLTVEGTEFRRGEGETDLIWRIAKIAPDRLWAEFIDLDNSLSIQANFGHLVNIAAADAANRSNFDYLSAVRGLFHSFFTGPTRNSIRLGVQLLNGLPVSEETGTVIEITRPNDARIGRIRIRDRANPEIVRIYFYPTELGVEDIEDPETHILRPLQPGDVVEKFKGLAKGVVVNDYINSPLWWKQFNAQGLISEVEKFATFQVVVNTEIFDIDNIDVITDFLNEIKPTYTKIAFVILASRLIDTIEVLDSLSANVTKHMVDGVFVPPFDLDHVDGAGASMFRLDFDTNFPVSTSPQLELAEMSKFNDVFAPELPSMARLSDIPDNFYVVAKSTTTRSGMGSVQPDGLTFIADSTGSYSGVDVGKTIIINGHIRQIVAVASDTIITVSGTLSIFVNANWVVLSNNGNIDFGLATLTDTTAHFINAGGVELVDEGDFLELVHSGLNSGAPTRFHIEKAASNTEIKFTNLTELFNTTSATYSGNYFNATWRVIRGLRYMPKPANTSPILGTNLSLNESRIPAGFPYLTGFVFLDASPTTNPPTGSAPGIVDGVNSVGIASALGGFSVAAVFGNEGFISNSSITNFDGSLPTPKGLPTVHKIVLIDTNSSSPDGLKAANQEIEVYAATSPIYTGPNLWTLVETFNTPTPSNSTSSRQAFRIGQRIELVFRTPVANATGFKVRFPTTALNDATGTTIVFSEMELHLSAEFVHLSKNVRLDIMNDSRPEDVVFVVRTLTDPGTRTGTGDGSGSTFTDTNASPNIKFSIYDIGKSITITDAGPATIHTIIGATAVGSDYDIITVVPAFAAVRTGETWTITTVGANMLDGVIR